MGWLDWVGVHRRRTVAIVVALQLAIALPFLVVDPADVRGIPGPLLLTVSIAASVALGARLGMLLTALAGVLAVTIIGEGAVALPVWVVLAGVTGAAGDGARRAGRAYLELQAEFQSGLMPPTRTLRSGGLAVARRYVPSERRLNVSGDFYGLVEQDDGVVAFVVGDVSGHGAIPAAIGANIRAGWRVLAMSRVEPMAVVTALNRQVVDERQRGRHASEVFATACFCWLDRHTDTLSVIAAGHPPPLLVTPDGVSELATRFGPPLGALEEATWTIDEVPLTGTWSLVLYTDGLVEGRAAPHDRERYGVGRLSAFLRERAADGIDQDDVDALLREVEHANGGRSDDDVVVLALSSRPTAPRFGIGERGSLPAGWRSSS